nr:2-hydroxymuconate tautomerase family protein [Sphingomonas sp. CDS-1]
MPIIDVTMVEGRSPEAKDAFVRALTEAAVAAIAAPRESVRVILREVPSSHFAAGGVTIAQRRAATESGGIS